MNVINFPEDNQMLDYCRLNPNMTVPVLEIDDRIITDSMEISRYVRSNYPGPGDRMAPPAAVDAFVQKLGAWDEGLFTYRRLGGVGALANDLRLLRLRQALAGAMGLRTSCFSGVQQLSADRSSEVLRDGRTVLDVYVKKIAQIQLIKEVGAGQMTPDLERRIARNDALTKELFAEAERLLQQSKGRFLFVDELCTADGFWISIVFRIGDTDAPLRQALFKEFPRVQAYWDCFTRCEESDVILPYGMSWAKRMALRNGVPRKLLGMKLGLLRPPALTEPVEAMIRAELARQRAAYYE